MTFREIEKILLDDGWYKYKITGAHYQYKHKMKSRENNNCKTYKRHKKDNYF